MDDTNIFSQIVIGKPKETKYLIPHGHQYRSIETGFSPFFY
jgi:hypothetical protein